MNEISIDLVVKIKSSEGLEPDVFEAHKEYKRKDIESDFIHEQVLAYTRSIKTMIDDKFHPKPKGPESTGEKVIVEPAPEIKKLTTFVSDGGEISRRGHMRNMSQDGRPLYYKGNTDRK